MSEWVRACVSGSVTLYLVDTKATIVFAQSLSNFTCIFAMMRGGTLLILGHGVKGQGQLWLCHDERRNPIDFGSRGQRSRSTLAWSTFALCI